MWFFTFDTNCDKTNFATIKNHEMENISETVLMCMIAIAAIQFTIIFTILKSRKKDNQEIVSNKKTLIEILNSSSATSANSIEECCG